MKTPFTLQALATMLVLFLFNSSPIVAQIDYTANDRIATHTDPFRFGINLGYYPNWTNQMLGDISAGNEAKGIPGIGAQTARPALYEAFLEDWGYEFQVPTFEYYKSLGFTDHSVLVGDPSWAHRDQTHYCATDPSAVFANLYTPIWDGGANGTPVNEDNYFAVYLYKVATIYKDYIKVWEILNEPDFDFSGTNWYYEDQTQGWWVRNPDPCEYQLRAPIQYYVRTMRIAWEVIKSVDPDALVSIGALGYPHFLDAVMRNTDNPIDGSATAEYPFGAGAYFDVMGYHTYPHIDGSLWNYSREQDAILGFNRHSDEAVAGLERKKVEFDEVLEKYGYDGVTYPAKIYTITESNLPRASFADPRYHGTDEMQINYTIKSSVAAQRIGSIQYHMFKLGDEKPDNQATFEFEVMGMYRNMDGTNLSNAERTNAGIAYKTTSDLLFGRTYDAERTAALNMPSNVDGGAFRGEDGSYIYVLWAKTSIDRSEYAETSYTFPFQDVSQVGVSQWNYSVSGDVQIFNTPTIPLTGAPVFVTTDGSIVDGGGGDNGGGDNGGGDNGGGSDGMDLALNISVDNPNTGIYENRTFTLTLTNEGNETANNVMVDFKVPQGFANVSQVVNQGNYLNWVGEWQVGSVAAGQTASMELTLFTLSGDALNAYAQIASASGNDIDSTPGNGSCCTPQEDDESAVTLGGGGAPIGLQRSTETDVPYLTLHRVFPQPAQDELKIFFSSPEEQIKLTIYSAEGEKMLTQKVQEAKGFNQVSTDISSLPNGFYFILFDSANGQQPMRFLKMK